MEKTIIDPSSHFNWFIVQSRMGVTTTSNEDDVSPHMRSVCL